MTSPSEPQAHPRYPTASQLPRAASCLYPWAPNVAWADDAPGPAAKLGTAVHGAIAMSLTGGVTILAAAPTTSDEWRLYTAWQRSELSAVPSDALVEPAFAYSHWSDETGLIGCNVGRDYGKYASASGFLCGSADVTWCADGLATVIDWKVTLRPDSGYSEPAAESRQLWALGLFASRYYRVHRARLVRAVISPRGVETDEYTMDAADLDATRDALRAMAAAIDSGRAEPNPGDHCRYCPARAVCPAQQEASAQLGTAATIPPPASLAAVPLSAAIDSPERAAYVLARLPMLRSAVEDMEQRLRAYADEHGGIATEKGVWCRKEQKRETIDLGNSRGAHVLTDLGLGAAVDVSTSKSAIDRAAKDAGLPRSTVVDALGALRDLGCVRETTTTSYGVRK